MFKKKFELIYLKTALLIIVIAAVLLSGCLDMFFPPAVNPTPTATRTPWTSQRTPSAPVANSTPPLFAARILRIEFDSPMYRAGDQVTPSLIIQNTGSRTITAEKVTVKATCVRLNDFLGNLVLQTKSQEEKTRSWTFDYTETILPAETKVVSALFNTQAEASGIRLAGDYDILVTLEVNGKYADSNSLRITLY